MLLDFIYPAPLCYEEDNRPGVLKYVHYLYFSMLLSFITLVTVVVISLATEEPKPEQVKPLDQMAVSFLVLLPAQFYYFIDWYEESSLATSLEVDIKVHTFLLLLD